MTPEDLKLYRRQLGLTQDGLGALVGRCGDRMLVYERGGAAIPPKVANAVLRLVHQSELVTHERVLDVEGRLAKAEAALRRVNAQIRAIKRSARSDRKDPVDGADSRETAAVCGEER